MFFYTSKLNNNIATIFIDFSLFWQSPSNENSITHPLLHSFICIYHLSHRFFLKN